MTDRCILVVEDERILAEDIKLELREMGYAWCESVSSGEKAVQRAARGDVGLILMDIKLEGRMDGIEAAEKINNLCSIPLIYLTAFSDKAFFERAKRTAPHGYLLKPFRSRELQAAIEIALYKFEMEKKLRRNVHELRHVMGKRKSLEGLIPICSNCKKVRESNGAWNLLELYIEAHSEAMFSHSICPECARSVYPEFTIYDDPGSLCDD